MPAAVASNLYQASRAEVLADYLFSSWGTVAPVRRQDDTGIDLHCTLTERVGQRSLVRAYYSVQVKSNSDPWHLKTEDDVRWLFDYPTPLFLACVDQAALTLSVYQTMPRYLAGMWPATQQLDLVPSQTDQGKCAQWTDPERFDLSAPILRVTLANLAQGDLLAHFHSVLRFWVDADRNARITRDMGMLRLWMPYAYRVNEVPEASNLQQGMTRPSEEHRAAGVRTAVEVLDYIGDQLLRSKDTEGAVYATLLLRRLVDRDPRFFSDHVVLRAGGLSQLEHSVGFAMNEILRPGGKASWLLEGVETVKSAMQATDAMAAVLKADRGETADPSADSR
jgi:hypothetical protein